MIEIIKSENLLEEIVNLKSGENILIDLPKETVDAIRLIKLQRESLENLFMSYVNNTVEEANKFNLDKFVNLYGAKYEEEYLIMQNTIHNTVGTEIYRIISDERKYRFAFDFVLIKLIISRV